MPNSSFKRVLTEKLADYFHQPEVQALTRQLAAELELVGVPAYAQEIRKLYS